MRYFVGFTFLAITLLLNATFDLGGFVSGWIAATVFFISMSIYDEIIKKNK